MYTTTSTNVKTADFLLTRVGSLPTSLMKELLLLQSREIHQKVYAKQEEIEKIKPIVIDLLFDLVPKVGDEKKLLRKTIKFKRDIYNNRSFRANLPLIDELCLYLDETNSERLRKWYQLNEEILDLHDELNEVYRDETAKSIERVNEFFSSDRSEELMKGIAIASEDFAKGVLKNTKDLKKIRSNLSKTAFSYLQRSTVKTSPFSTLTQVKSIPLEQENAPPFEIDQENTHKRNSMKLNKALISSIGEAIGVTFQDHFKFKFNPIVNVNNEDALIKNNYLNTDGFFWKNEEVIKNKRFITIIKDLPTRFRTEPFYLTELSNYIDEKKLKFYQKTLISSKVLRPVLPIPSDADHRNIFTKLALPIKSESEQVQSLKSLLREADKAYEKLAEFSISAQDRIAIIQELKNNIYGIYDVLNCKEPRWLRSINFVYEDVMSSIDNIFLPSKLQIDLEDLHQKVSTKIQLNPLYHKITQYFIDHYDADKKHNLLEFIFTLANQKEYMRMVQDSRDQLNSEEENNLTVSGTSHAVPSSDIYFQLAANEEGELSEENYLIVVNKVSNGLGSVYARFNSLLDRTYKDQLNKWISGLFPQSNAMEFSPGGDWSNLQENYDVLDAAISDVATFPYMEPNKDVLNIEQLMISYNKDTNTLDLSDDHGNTVSPVYLGTTPQYLLVGPIGILLNLVNPWITNTDFGINPRPWNDYGTFEEITYVPRYQEKNVVYNRARWIVPVDKILLKQNTESDVDYFERINTFRLNHNIPEETYLTLQSSDTSQTNGHKPIWMHFNSPYCLEMLNKKVNSSTTYLEFTESLPNISSSALRNSEGEVFVGEFMSLGRCFDE
ncbi:lantibiotic dehydratase [Alkalihalobacillus sp. R86527]|uniref:lantibiotic dehydratase n=1 Tax=Alkalihalobacillus sp. R86527 TaxID=3093863 RepID=UPI00366D3E47